MSSPQPAVYVAGIGMTPTGKFLDRSIKQLSVEAVNAALADAGLTREAIGAAFFSNATQGVLEGQTMVRGQIALRSMEEPLRQIVENAGGEGSVVFQKVAEAKETNFGYNAATGEYGDLFAQGVIDPVKVTRSALANAASIASLLLTTETSVVEKPADEEESHGHGHGHSH